MTEQYPYIRAWGIHMGSYPYYIADEQARAKADDAPKDAIYRTWRYTADGRPAPGTYNEEEMQKYGIVKVWVRAAEIARGDTRAVFTQICERLGIPVPSWEEVPRGESH